MTDMVRCVWSLLFFCVLWLTALQEGLKQHEGGQRATNPYDMFSSFFGGRELLNDDVPFCCSDDVFVDQQQETRRGPTTTSDFEVSLEDM